MFSRKEIIAEQRGYIKDIYEYPVCEGAVSSTEKGIIIQPDNPREGDISECFAGRDYTQFHIGQRVVHVSYTWKRPATDMEKKRYQSLGRECPAYMDDYDYVTYDESWYDNNKHNI